MQSNEFFRKVSHCIDFDTCPTNIKPDVSTLRPSEVVELVPEDDYVALVL